MVANINIPDIHDNINIHDNIDTADTLDTPDNINTDTIDADFTFEIENFAQGMELGKAILLLPSHFLPFGDFPKAEVETSLRVCCARSARHMQGIHYREL